MKMGYLDNMQNGQFKTSTYLFKKCSMMISKAGRNKNLYFVEVPLNDYASHKHIIFSCHHCLLYHHKTKPVHNYNKNKCVA